MATTPMMQQYQDAKAACGDAILLFRMGDFYELFHEDAKTAARVLGLTLTSRDKTDSPIPMAGFPHHQLEPYLKRLIAAGFRAAVCEQVEDPKVAKGLVKRELTRVVTPGTVTDDALLDPRESNYLAAICQVTDGKDSVQDEFGIAWAELSTGRFWATVTSRARWLDELARIGPSELLVGENAAEIPVHVTRGMMITKRPNWAFAHDTALTQLTKHFGITTLEGLGFTDQDEPAIRAAGAVLDYLRETQRSSLDHIDRVIPYRNAGVLQIDESSRRSLELTRTIRDGRRDGSLLAVLDRTITAMGARHLADWLANPSTNLEVIQLRQDAVGELVDDSGLRAAIQHELNGIYDLQRLLARVTTGRASPRDLSFVGRTLGRLPTLKLKMGGRRSRLLNQLETEIDLCPDLHQRLSAGLADDCPLLPRDGGFIRTGFNENLDGLRELATGGKQWIAQYQATEAERSGIPSLKVGFNAVFGYYLEITNTHREKIPDHYIRKQTLKNAERFITPELKEYEEKVLSADDKAKQLEYDLFLELRDSVLANVRRLQATAEVLAQLDTLCGLADLARERAYVRPRVVADPVLNLRDSRHPVLDILEPQGTFVPNDAIIGGSDGTCLLITGPNMAGKSTFIRQVALITLMAQMGSFVPAKEATIGCTDRIFARVGASDELSRGQSTFMVEMTETARILNTATRHSLVILDEIGRGTSTYDGISLAWAIVEHLHDRVGCRTFFATHYHELTDLASSMPDVRNFNVAVREWGEQVVFLHKILPGAADKSYGIHVARLAGVPREVNERAKQILNQLESDHLDSEGRPRLQAPTAKKKRKGGDIQLTLFAPMDHPIVDEIRSIDVDNLTPVSALQQIQDWQRRLATKK